MIKAADVKNAVSLKEALSSYGIELDRSGFTLCPFHREKTPSFKVKNDRFYCFGCNTSGDVIDFVQKYFGLSFTQALIKLDNDFSLGLDDKDFDYQKYEEMKRINKRFEEIANREKRREKEIYQLVCDLLQKYKAVMEDRNTDPKAREKAIFRTALLNAVLDDCQESGMLLRAFGDYWRKKEPQMIEDATYINYNLVAVLRDSIAFRAKAALTADEEETIEELESRREKLQRMLADLDEKYMDQVFRKMQEYIFKPSDLMDETKTPAFTGRAVFHAGMEKKKEAR